MLIVLSIFVLLFIFSEVAFATRYYYEREKRLQSSSFNQGPIKDRYYLIFPYYVCYDRTERKIFYSKQKIRFLTKTVYFGCVIKEWPCRRYAMLSYGAYSAYSDAQDSQRRCKKTQEYLKYTQNALGVLA